MREEQVREEQANRRDAEAQHGRSRNQKEPQGTRGFMAPNQRE